MKKQSYLKGAFIISAGGFISKLLGAVYRIPLIAFLGGHGMGVYQMVYPLYCILLTVSASGIPTGIARVISSGQCENAERSAFRLYGVIGLIGSLAMFALSVPLSVAQGEPAVALCCKLLSPSVFFVSVLSVVRGYFQGKGNMTPTAVSEVMEQAVKVCFGIALAYVFRADSSRAVAAAIFAVTVSEVLSACYAVTLYAGWGARRVKPLYAARSDGYREILKYTVPLTFTAIAMPASQLVESIVVVAILRGFADNATALWGVFSGCAITLINLPVSVTYGLAAASVPNISPLAESGDMRSAFREVRKSLLFTCLISVPFAVALYFLSPYAADVIFRSLEPAERELLVNLVKIMAVNAVTLSLVQTSSACLTSLGKPLYGTVTQWVSSVVRVALSAALVAVPSLSVAGAAISANCSYLVAVLLNFWYIGRVKGAKDGNTHRTWQSKRRYNVFG